MDLKDTYNKIAEDWSSDHRDDTWWVPGINKFASLFKENDKILDVGCGAGQKSKFLSDKGLKVTGTDFSEKMIEIAKKKDPSSTFFVMGIKDVSKLDELFDGILAQAILLHVPKNEIESVFKDLVSKIKEKGYLYIAVKEVGPGKEEELIVKENDYGYEYERFFSYFTVEEIKKYFSDLNMKICHEEIIHSGKRNWIQVIGQKQ